MKDAHNEANANAGSSGNSDLFQTVLGHLTQQKGQIADNAQHLNEQGKTFCEIS